MIHGNIACKKNKLYFTEIGTYAALMKSSKPIAI